LATEAATIRRRRSSAASSWVDRHIRWLLVSPAILIIVALTIFPLGFSLWVSFVQYDFSLGEEHPWVGLGNFRVNWVDPVWRHSLYVTAVLATLNVVVELALGFLLALAMLRPFRGRRVLMTLFVLPLFMSPVIVGGFFDLFVRRPFGPTNWLLGKLLGHPVTIDFTNDAYWPFFSLIVADAWQWTPFMFVILLAGLSSIPDELYESARIDGAGRWAQFWHVTLPMLSPALFFASVVGVLFAFQSFGQIDILTQGGPVDASKVVLYSIYQEGFQNFRYGAASVQAIVLFFILLALTLAQFRLLAGRVFYR